MHQLGNWAITHTQKEKLALYQKHLLHWNKRTDLISKHDQENLFSRHILNCLNFLHLLKPKDLIIHDIGSGSGLPGLVCRICDETPERAYYLFEKKYQKRSFLKNMVVTLGLENIFICESYPNVSRETLSKASLSNNINHKIYTETRPSGSRPNLAALSEPLASANLRERENVSRETCDVLTSRALLSVIDLENYKDNFKKFILFKGTNYQDEIKLLNSNIFTDNVQIYKAQNDDSYLLLGERYECFT